MKHIIKTVALVVLAAFMVVSAEFVASAETVAEEKEEIILSIEDIDDDSKAYELVWKYKEDYGHLWRRRWNATLGEWYDPAWILVY